MNLKDALAAQLLIFERPSRVQLDNRTGLRMLLGFALVGMALHPILRSLTSQAPDMWKRTLIVGGLLLGVIVVLSALLEGRPNLIGLHAWSDWTPRERIYLWTVIPTATVVFGVVFRNHFASLYSDHGLMGLLLITIPLGFVWGFVQETIYRGFLQTELTRRGGGFAGVFLANVIFTFGPLHFSYLELGSAAAPRWGMLTAIFLIGIFFGILYERSGNLWLPAVLHGLWPLNMS